MVGMSSLQRHLHMNHYCCRPDFLFSFCIHVSREISYKVTAGKQPPRNVSGRSWWSGDCWSRSWRSRRRTIPVLLMTGSCCSYGISNFCAIMVGFRAVCSVWLVVINIFILPAAKAIFSFILLVILNVFMLFNV